MVAVNEVEVFAIFVNPALKSDAVDDCHLTIDPVFPLNVNGVEFVPVHTVALPPIVPATVAGLTVTVPVALDAESHDPLFTMAL